jgi:hypothetical protein
MPATQAPDSRIDTRPAVRSRATVLWGLVIFAAWAAIVVVGLLHHAFWRDEVRALTLALDADSLSSIPAAIHGEGHPALWYLLLRTSYDIFGTKAVLPALNLLIAAAAVIIFLWQAPFSLWWKALFVLSAIVAYEYSIMSRNYSIVMLLMFLFAVVYTAPRRSPLWLILILFLLTQTHVIAALLTPFYLFIWFSDWWSGRKSGSPPADRLLWIILAAVVSSAGMLAAFATVYPTNNDLVLRPLPDGMRILRTIGSAILQPGYFYCEPPVSERAPWCATGGRLRLAETARTALLYFAVAGLAVRLPLLLSALGGLWGTTLFFQVVYWGYYRHQAIWIVFLISLYWLAFAGREQALQVRSSIKSRVLLWSFYGAFATLLVINTGIRKVYADNVYEISKTRALSDLLKTSTDLRDAIILAEPEQIAEGTPYYVDNHIYLLREGKFGKVATWSSRTSKLNLTLRDILVTARELKDKTGRPILILLEYPVTVVGSQQGREFGSPSPWRFRYDGDQASEFLAATRKLPLGPQALLEDFDAYLLQ